MEFTKVIGNIEPSLVKAAQDKLTKSFLELATKYDSTHFGSGLGGDPLIFMLLYPTQHICTLSLPTAATNGKQFFWNPKFVLKQSAIGLRLIEMHEAAHALYMHPQRLGSRLPKLWNIAVDYIVNGMAMEDLETRKHNPGEMFSKHLGKYMTIAQFSEQLKDPFKPQKGFEELDPNTIDNSPKVNLPSMDEDRDLTDAEKKELERREKKTLYFYADPKLPDDLRSPEEIYAYFYNLLPKCPQCGSVGVYKRPKKNDKNKDKAKAGDKGEKGKGKNKDKADKGDKGEKNQDQNHDHGDGDPCDCKDHGKEKGDGNGDQDSQENGDSHGEGCGSCEGENGEGFGSCDGCGAGGDGLDIFDLGGGTVDTHLPSEETPEKLAKRFSDAMESCRRMAGHVPSAMEDELGKLIAPTVTWQDIIKARLTKIRQSGAKNDWTRFRSRPMFSGMLIPKKKSYYATFGCLLDTSGSMLQEDLQWGVSQLASLDDRAEGWIIPADASIYWEEKTFIKRANAEELCKTKIVGRGGTCFGNYFSEYAKEVGHADFHIVVTDGYLIDDDVASMENPGVPVYWIITSSSNSFKPPFGKVFHLKND